MSLTKKKYCINCKTGEQMATSSKFYFEDPLVYVAVGNHGSRREVMYRVHNANLKRESPVLKTILDDHPDSGTNRGDPLSLSDYIVCTCEAFDIFLTYVYEGDKSFVRENVYDYLDLLKIFTDFECSSAITMIRTKFRAAAASLEPFEQLKLANEHGFTPLKMKAFTTLACRGRMLTDKEAESMNMSDVLRLARIRERLLLQRSGVGGPMLDLYEKDPDMDIALCETAEQAVFDLFPDVALAQWEESEDTPSIQPASDNNRPSTPRSIASTSSDSFDRCSDGNMECGCSEKEESFCEIPEEGREILGGGK